MVHAAEHMIVVDDLHKHFGGFHAVDGSSLAIDRGSITGLIGPNGAGKTTLFNVIAGVLKPTSGRVYMDGEDITGMPPHDLFHKGLLRTFQIAHEFHSMSCRENLMMVPGGQSGETLWNTWFGRKRIARCSHAVSFLWGLWAPVLWPLQRVGRHAGCSHCTHRGTPPARNRRGYIV